ncbi:MAG: TatD family hydrolase [Desulfobacteraceae bacterium]|nr:TatD family hydrolase [Desulfobacteraceae bacterium]
MRFIDPHLHTDMINDIILENLSMAGMEAAIVPSPHMLKGCGTSDTILRLWDRFLDFEVNSGKAMGYELFASLSIPFYGLDRKNIDACLKQLPEYLKHERVVAMGEIGLDCAIPEERELFRDHLQIAKEHNIPLIVHTPIRLAPQAPEVIKNIVEIIKEEKFPIEKVVLDHTGENTFDYRAETGAMVGLSVCHDKMPPEAAADCVINNADKRDKLIINCELAGGDMYFTVPRVALALRMKGMAHDDIERVVWDNPKNFFDLPVD